MPTSHDPAEGPPSRHEAPTRWFGVPPPLALLGVSVGLLVLAIVLFGTGSWPIALVLLGLSALFLAAFLEIARRRPYSSFTRASAGAAAGARSWASTRFELVRARSSAVAEVQRVRARRSLIESERRMALLRLGEAERSEDRQAADAARKRLSELETAEKGLYGREEAGKARADERIARLRFSVEQTMVVLPEPELDPPPDEDFRRPAA